MNFTDDKAFAERLLAGDEVAYDELFEVHAQKVYRFALARVGTPEVAEDLVQTTLARALPKLEDYRGEASLLTWLCAFCRFEILAHWRKEGRRGEQVEWADDLPEVARALELAGSYDTERPEGRALQRESKHLVRTLLDHLPGSYGDVLEWKYLDELSVEAIAERLSITRTAAQSMLARARQAFRDGLAEVSAASRESLLSSEPEKGDA